MTKEELRRLIGLDHNIQSVEEKEQFVKNMCQHGLDPNSYFQELEMSSPYVNTHQDISYSHEVVGLHSHAFYEVICCRSSCGVGYLVGPYRYALQKGDIIFIRPGVSHRPILPEPLSIPYERDILWISEAYLLKIMESIGVPTHQELPSYLIRTANTHWEYLCDMIHNGVLEEERKQQDWQLAVIGNTMSVVAHFHRAYLSLTTHPLKAENRDLLDDIIAYIEAHYQEKLVMSEVARQFFVSERTISSLFRQRLGVTFCQFLTQRRLIAAKSLILEGILLESVGEQTGFGDYSTFYRAFKAEFGISPREFKKMQERMCNTVMK